MNFIGGKSFTIDFLLISKFCPLLLLILTVLFCEVMLLVMFDRGSKLTVVCCIQFHLHFKGNIYSFCFKCEPSLSQLAYYFHNVQINFFHVLFYLLPWLLLYCIEISKSVKLYNNQYFFFILLKIVYCCFFIA